MSEHRVECMGSTKLHRRLNTPERVLMHEIRWVTFLGAYNRCRVTVRKLLSLWNRVPECPMPGTPADRAVLTENRHAMGRELPR